MSRLSTSLRTVTLVSMMPFMLISGEPSFAIVFHRHGLFGLHMHAVTESIAVMARLSTEYGHLHSGTPCSSVEGENVIGGVIFARQCAFEQDLRSRHIDRNECLSARPNPCGTLDADELQLASGVRDGFEANFLSHAGSSIPVLIQNCSLLI
jgi:hypothetical protein